MKRFVLSCGDSYYPSKGFGDFVKSFDTREEAEAFLPIHKAEKDYRIDQWYLIEDLNEYD